MTKTERTVVRKMGWDECLKQLTTEARALKSEHGENPEYDRALVELVTFTSGLTAESLRAVALELGIKPERLATTEGQREGQGRWPPRGNGGSGC